jgi:hypothetical protein
MRTERATADRESTPCNLIERLLRKIQAGQIPCSMCTARVSIRNRRPTCATCARLARQRH